MTTPSPAIAYVSRRYRFAASHRLYTAELSDAQNRAIYGKCAGDNGHGHNYQIVVTIAGPVDPLTGMVVNLDALDALVRDRILRRYDHRYLNLDVEDYVDLVPTGENIVRHIWSLLRDALPAGRLSKVRLVETRDNSFEYQGEAA